MACICPQEGAKCPRRGTDQRAPLLGITVIWGERSPVWSCAFDLQVSPQLTLGTLLVRHNEGSASALSTVGGAGSLQKDTILEDRTDAPRL